MTTSPASSIPSEPTPASLSSSSATDRVIIVARHAERLDNVLREKEGVNWLATAARPYDAPVTSHGQVQGGRLGQQVVSEISRLGLPPLTAIYSSSFLRARQTAVAALQSILEKSASVPVDETSFQHSTSDGVLSPRLQQVRVEHGLTELIESGWYRSWALPGSNGIWGFGGDSVITPETLHPAAKVPIQNLLDWQAAAAENGEDEFFLSLLDGNYQCLTGLEKPYCFYPPLLESHEDQRRRILQVVDQVSVPGQTVLLVTHGGPIEHIFEEMTGLPWTQHGALAYCAYSIYRQRGTDPWEAVVINESNHIKE